MDTLTASVSPIPDPLPSFAWLVAYSGVTRELTKSGFNVRVDECHQAAKDLIPDAKMLSDVPREIYEVRKQRLPENLRKRAQHYFTEVERVHQGAKAWQEANQEVFGQLMNQSCHSSINNYESGSDILIELHELISGMDGVYGSRFSGGGYGGCVIALVHRASAENICARVTERFSARHPELQSKVFAAETGDGLSPVLSIVIPAVHRSRAVIPPRRTSPKRLLSIIPSCIAQKIMTHSTIRTVPALQLPALFALRRRKATVCLSR